MPNLKTIAKNSIPWVRRAAAVFEAYELAQQHRELTAQIKAKPLGKERAKLHRKLADLEIELEKAVGKLQ